MKHIACIMNETVVVRIQCLHKCCTILVDMVHVVVAQILVNMVHLVVVQILVTVVHLLDFGLYGS